MRMNLACFSYSAKSGILVEAVSIGKTEPRLWTSSIAGFVSGAGRNGTISTPQVIQFSPKVDGFHKARDFAYIHVLGTSGAMVHELPLPLTPLKRQAASTLFG